MPATGDAIKIVIFALLTSPGSVNANGVVDPVGVVGPRRGQLLWRHPTTIVAIDSGVN